MRGRSRGFELGPRARERELQRSARRLRLTLFRRQRTPDRLRALRFSLLKLDVLAFKSSRQLFSAAPAQYSKSVLKNCGSAALQGCPRDRLAGLKGLRYIARPEGLRDTTRGVR